MAKAFDAPGVPPGATLPAALGRDHFSDRLLGRKAGGEGRMFDRRPG